MDVKNDLAQNVEIGTQEDASEQAYTDSQLQKEIDELDEALYELETDRRALQDRQANKKQQARMLKEKVITQKIKLSWLKASSVCAGILRIGIMGYLCFAMLFALESTFNKADERLAVEKDEILSGYRAQTKEIDKNINALTQQMKEIDKNINALAQQRKEIDENINALTQQLAQQRGKLQKEAAIQSIKAQSDQISVASTVLTEHNREELDDYIASLRRYPIKRVEQKTYDGTSYYQVVQRHDMPDGYLLNDMGNASVYPGAVLRGDSLMQGTANYTLVGQNRTPMTLTCSRGGNSIRLENISYGTVTQAVEQLWAESNSGYSQKWEYSVHSMQSEEELKLNLGISTGGASTSFGVSHTNKTSTIAISFTETYFSIVAEPQVSPTQYFQDGCDLKSLGDYEPAYVSSVDYGRRLVVLVTTELSEDELNAKLDANIHGVDIGAGIKYIEKNIDSGYRIFAYGGDSAKSLRLINGKSGWIRGWWDEIINKSETIDDINSTIVETDTLINPAPLAYHLKYLSDNSAVPATAILNDNIILAEDAKLVTITLTGDKAVPGLFRLDNSVGTIGYVLDKDWIQITKKGETSGEIQFIWDSSQSASLMGYFNDELVSYPLKELSTETDNPSILDEDPGIFSTAQTYMDIYISEAVYEIN